MATKIPNELLKLLDDCSIEEKLLYLPAQLDRKTYVKLNKILEIMGGKWNRKQKAHVFPDNPQERIEEVMLTGEVTDLQKEFDFFPTPPNLAQTMVEWAEIQPEDILLEPSAGKGGIADFFPKENPALLVELEKQNAQYLEEKGYVVCVEDFLQLDGVEADKIIMNPPFSKQRDIEHILHAYEALKEGGTLVSVVSESPFFRDNQKSQQFRSFLIETNAEVHQLPEGTFKTSGTMVNTRLIKLHKPLSKTQKKQRRSRKKG